jgi:hypothetical protein
MKFSKKIKLSLPNQKKNCEGKSGIFHLLKMKIFKMKLLLIRWTCVEMAKVPTIQKY